MSIEAMHYAQGHDPQQSNLTQRDEPEAQPVDGAPMADTSFYMPAFLENDEQGRAACQETEQPAEEAGASSDPSGPSAFWSVQPMTPFPERSSSGPLHTPLPSFRIQARRRRVLLPMLLLALLLVAGALLLPALFSAQPTLISGAPTPTSPLFVGDLSFSSSGQLDPSGAQGINDGIVVNLHHLAPPAPGDRYEGWLLPDSTDTTTPPLLLGPLTLTGGNASLSYVQPHHVDLLARYSGFAVAEQPADQTPTMLPRDPRLLPYMGRIPNIPTPGDEQHYSLLDHLRHLLAKDPTLQDIGLQGGLALWLARNTEKILEWSSAARDSWSQQQGDQAGNLDAIHRQMLRVLDYLDGSAYVEITEDVPAGSPLLVDPEASRIGLLAISPTQSLPAYLTHVGIHLQGLIAAPGHTQAQEQLATRLAAALAQITAQLQQVHQEAVTLVHMDDAQLASSTALALLDAMVTHATIAYTGEFDPVVGGNTNGVLWITQELQGIATIPVMAAMATPAANTP